MAEESMRKSTSPSAREKKAPGTKKGTASKKDKKAGSTPVLPSESKRIRVEPLKSTRSGNSKTVLQNPKSRPGGKKRKKPDMKEILFRKFDKWVPNQLFRIEPTRKTSTREDSPSTLTGKDGEETARIRKLLSKKFDLSEPSEIRASGLETSKPAEPEFTKTRSSDPMALTLKLILIGFALLMALVIKVSASNRSNYYIKPAASGVEIWQGIFAPIGSERLLTLAFAAPPARLRDSYTREEVSLYVYDHYIQRADRLLQRPGTPDLELVKTYLAGAMPYAMSEDQRAAVRVRMNNIDRMVLLIKADAAAAKNTLADYDAALAYLKQAQALAATGTEANLIRQKIEAVDSAIAAIKKDQAAVQKSEPTSAPPSK